jgi:probable F420-dependent oxidoreductase
MAHPRPFRFGIQLSNAPSGAAWGELARQAEGLGYDTLFMPDHFGDQLAPVPALMAAADATTELKVGALVFDNDYKHPVVLAKELATIDVLSGGRLDLGVGVGWQREEYEAAGLSYEGRGPLLDHTVEVCQLLWREQRASYDGAGLRFEHIHQMPKPLQPGGVPVWVSGTVNGRSMQRLARFGTGWIPWGPDAEDPASVDVMKHAVAEAGGTADDLQVTWSLPIVRGAGRTVDPAATAAAVPALAAAGVTDVRFWLHPSDMTPEVLEPLVVALRSVVP